MTQQEVYDMACKIQRYCDKRTWSKEEPCEGCPLSIEYLYDNHIAHYGCALHDTPDMWELDREGF